MKLGSNSLVIALVIVVALGAVVFGILMSNKQPAPQTYDELTTLPSKKVEQIDIALMNLLCAENLPGSENLDIEQCLSMLDQWADLVSRNEAKYSAQFFQNQSRYDNSYAKFQAVNLGLTLKDDLKCEYNQELIRSGAMEDLQSTRFFQNSRDLFLHGFVETRVGSCSSLPVLMVAIGRRCGYPLHLVTCKGHLFCRWDDGHERFNIETACPGVDVQPDSYYMKWPYPTTEAEAKSEKYLKNLDSMEELALFVWQRAMCLDEHDRFTEASEAYFIALQSFPDSKYLKAYLSNVNWRK